MHLSKPEINGYINALLLKVCVKLVLIGSWIYLNPSIKTKKKKYCYSIDRMFDHSWLFILFFRNVEIYPMWKSAMNLLFW